MWLCFKAEGKQYHSLSTLLIHPKGSQIHFQLRGTEEILQDHVSYLTLMHGLLYTKDVLENRCDRLE